MKALEFSTTIKNNQIQIPKKIQSQFNPTLEKKKIKVIVLMNETDNNDDFNYKQVAKTHFLNGYADADDVYDTIGNE